jgi:hypothetical protein
VTGGTYLDPDVSGDAMRWSTAPPPPRPYVARRDDRFAHSFEAIEHVETTSCSRGCLRGAAPGSADEREFGPGGTCAILAEIAIGLGEEVRELDDQGDQVVCLVREPRPIAPPPPRRETVPPVVGQLPLFTE